jgi:hypothetical protein
LKYIKYFDENGDTMSNITLSEHAFFTSSLVFVALLLIRAYKAFPLGLLLSFI